MKQFRYNTHQQWFKGNTHIHSDLSDGNLNFSQLGQIYAEQGYDFLFRTDHWVASDVDFDPISYPLMWMDGIELDGQDETGSTYHIVCLGKFQGISRGLALIEAVNKARSQGGVIILAHPLWMGNSIADALRHPFDGVEVYNNVCQWMNSKGSGVAHWEAMLDQNSGTLGLAVDDAHITAEEPAWNGGWIMINAPVLTCEAVSQAIRTGNFYSSTGPEFQTIEYHNQRVYVKTSPVRAIHLVGPGRHGMKIMSPATESVTEAEFVVPEAWSRAYLHLEDFDHRQAWSNPLFIPGD
jgi:hypothetical protein